jgi:hypothetical protein
LQKKINELKNKKSNPIEDEDRFDIIYGLKNERNTKNKELAILLYSPWFLLEGLSIAVREPPSARTLAEPNLGIIISKVTKLHDFIDGYLKLSATDSSTHSFGPCVIDRLHEILLNYAKGTENTQLKFIEMKKTFILWSL